MSHLTGEDLIVEADRCLYEAKEAGRDRTLVASQAGQGLCWDGANPRVRRVEKCENIGFGGFV